MLIGALSLFVTFVLWRRNDFSIFSLFVNISAFFETTRHPRLKFYADLSPQKDIC
jgi:hypothetical protein